MSSVNQPPADNPQEHEAESAQHPIEQAAPPHKPGLRDGKLSDDERKALNIHNKGSLISLPPFRYNYCFQNIAIFLFSLWPFASMPFTVPCIVAAAIPKAPSIVSVRATPLSRPATLILESHQTFSPVANTC